MLQNVAAHTFVTEQDKDFKITVSIGIASSSEAAKTRGKILVHADKALYHSKDSGKNQITDYDEL